LFKDTKQR